MGGGVGLDERHAGQFGIDEDHLLQRLKGLGPAGDLAVRDALSRWWQASTNSEEDLDASSFAAAGLHILDEHEHEHDR